MKQLKFFVCFFGKRKETKQRENIDFDESKFFVKVLEKNSYFELPKEIGKTPIGLPTKYVDRYHLASTSEML